MNGLGLWTRQWSTVASIARWQGLSRMVWRMSGGHLLGCHGGKSSAVSAVVLRKKRWTWSGLAVGEVLVVPDSAERAARAAIKLASQLQVPLNTVLRALSEQETEFWAAPGSTLRLRDQREMVNAIRTGQ